MVGEANWATPGEAMARRTSSRAHNEGYFVVLYNFICRLLFQLKTWGNPLKSDQRVPDGAGYTMQWREIWIFMSENYIGIV